MKNKKNIIKNFLNQGFSVVDCENPNKLELLKEKIYKLSISLLKIKNLKPELFFDNLHENINSKNLNEFKISLIKKINNDKFFRNSYFAISNEILELIVGNELAMQKNLNLSIQLPKDSNSLLPLHADTWSGNSPFEVVIWIPLVDCYRTKSMFILPNSKYKKLFSKTKLKNISNSNQLYNHIKKDLKWIKVNYGQILIFNQSLPHGNIINKEKTTRWSFNCRFKSLFSPYGDKKLGEFFEIQSLKPASSVALNYEFPEFKKNG